MCVLGPCFNLHVRSVLALGRGKKVIVEILLRNAFELLLLDWNGNAKLLRAFRC